MLSMSEYFTNSGRINYKKSKGKYIHNLLFLFYNVNELIQKGVNRIKAIKECYQLERGTYIANLLLIWIFIHSWRLY